MKISNTGKLVVSIIIAEAAGIIGSIFTIPSISTWYAQLHLPRITPPNWLFGPVWTILFLFMGIAGFLIWKKGTENPVVIRALRIGFFQLLLNIYWSILFFGGHLIGRALIDIILLWGAIIVTIAVFGKISKPAAWLLVPYLLWVTFAAFLNYRIWVLN